MKYLIIFFLSFCAGHGLLAQEIVIEHDVDEEIKESRKGPNGKIFTHVFVGFGLKYGPPESPSASTKLFNSNQFQLGIRIKRKISGVLSSGLDLAYRQENFSIRQKQGVAPLLSGSLHHSENLKLYHLSAVPFFRFNFDSKRGDVLGRYFDVAFNFNWEFAGTHTYTDRLGATTRQGPRKRVVKNKQLSYLTDGSYGPIIRLGFGNFVLFTNYRLSNLFIPSSNIAELPRFCSGIEVVID